jgi:hypothetical protein
MFLTTFKTNAEATQSVPTWFRRDFSTVGYQTILNTTSQTPVLWWLFNSALAAVAHVVLVLATIVIPLRPAIRDVGSRLAAGGSIGAESSLNKIWWSELDVELHRVALDLLGPDAEDEGPWSKGWQFSLSGPIYAGTNEIQRNIAAERVLGLPRVK